MPITTARCPVLKADVTRVSDFEGLSTAIICAEFDKPGGICRLKKNALDGGPLVQLLERVEEGTLGHRSTRCDLS